MQCVKLFAFIALLSIAPFAASAGAQDADTDFGSVSTEKQFEGVAIPRVQVGTDTSFDGSGLQPYEVYFGEQYARMENLDGDDTPTFSTEFMVIEVKQGIFGLEVGAKGMFIVDPADETPIQFVDLHDDAQAPPYVSSLPKYVRNTAGNICTNMCALPENKAVQVKPGDIIIAQAGSLCLWCLLHGTGSDLVQEADGVPPKPDSGLLLVSVQLDKPLDTNSFSWIQAMKPSGMATPYATTNPATMAWAFNPPSGCH
jgi:hypothetical protein